MDKIKKVLTRIQNHIDQSEVQAYQDLIQDQSGDCSDMIYRNRDLRLKAFVKTILEEENIDYREMIAYMEKINEDGLKLFLTKSYSDPDEEYDQYHEHQPYAEMLTYISQACEPREES